MRRPVTLPAWTRLLGVRCYICGERERGSEKLQYHHIDGNPKNNADWNLAPAHKFCHRRVTSLNRQYSSAPPLLTDSRGRSEQREGEKNRVNPADFNEDASFLVKQDTQEKTEQRSRSLKIKAGLVNYLAMVALSKGETVKGILSNAPSWIDFNDPPSEQAIRRWLNIFTSGQYIYRFDPLGRLYMLDSDSYNKPLGR